jgi:hypothetical protein
LKAERKTVEHSVYWVFAGNNLPSSNDLSEPGNLAHVEDKWYYCDETRGWTEVDENICEFGLVDMERSKGRPSFPGNKMIKLYLEQGNIYWMHRNKANKKRRNQLNQGASSNKKVKISGETSSPAGDTTPSIDESILPSILIVLRPGFQAPVRKKDMEKTFGEYGAFIFGEEEMVTVRDRWKPCWVEIGGDVYIPRWVSGLASSRRWN